MATSEDDVTWEHCPHYMVGPADMHGVGICQTCGSAVQMRLAGHPVEEFFTQETTVVAKEGDDVAFDWPGTG